MTYVFAWLAGLLTLINPCILPVLPVVLASAVQGHRYGPLALAAGMASAFVAAGLGAALAGQALGLTTDDLSRAGAWMMVAFGLVLVVPQFSHRFELAAAGLAGRADAGIARSNSASLWGQALAGALLGLVWSPCVGPTLGGAIALSYQGENLFQAGLIMLAFALGAATVMLALAWGFRGALPGLRRLSVWSRPVMGAALLLIGAGILTGTNNSIEGWAVEHLPVWLQDLSVSI